MTTSHTFIKAAEIWVPGADGYLLEFQSGVFGPSAWGFAHMTRSMCFGRGEGLPGRVWEAGRPLLLSKLDGSYFRRTAAARALGITGAVAVPYFAEGLVQAVLVFFCGNEATQAGASELWYADAGSAGVLTLLDGAYGPQAQAFEAHARTASFAPGVGLPGMAQTTGQACFLEDLSTSEGGFARSALAVDHGLVRGLALPFGAFQGVDHVVAFLASEKLPLAHRVERWVLDPSGSYLERAYAFSELHGGHSRAQASLPLPTLDASGAIGRAWRTGLPAINEQPTSEPGPPAAAASGNGASGLVAIPLRRDGVVSEVVVLYL